MLKFIVNGFLQRVYYFFTVVCITQCSVVLPKFVSAVSRSCAEIQCTFHNIASRSITRLMWIKREHGVINHGVAIIYDTKSPLSQHYNYRERVEFKGNLANGQCSLLLKDIKKSDEGTYEFLMEISTDFYLRSYRTKPSQVFLSVSEKPVISGSGELIAGQEARLTCSITYNCPIDNIQLKWNIINMPLTLLWDTQDRSGILNKRSGSQRVSSVITFTPSYDHHRAILGCTILIDGFKTSPQTVSLEFKYKPTIVAGPTCTSSENWMNCTCSVRANPPGNITWSLNARIHIRNRSDVEVITCAVNNHLLQSSLLLAHPTGTGNLISCVAANEHGDSVSNHQLQSEGIFIRIIVHISGGGGATGIVVLIVVVLKLKIQRRKRREATSVSETHDDLVIYSMVQRTLTTERNDQYTDAGRRALESSKPAQHEEIVYATVNIANFRKYERYIENEETCEYAPIKYN
uniref:sialic acid-binding Ig-like lectin 12 n=1 Tax=Pristiophorus japonicus TaxID=55135 RepID=UPI00398EA648